MKRAFWLGVLAFCSLAAGLGCAGDAPTAADAETAEIVMQPVEMGAVPFNHGAHMGYGFACTQCHHTVSAGGFPSEGCVSCHPPAADGGDAALAGPEDTLRLQGADQDLAALPAVPFNHYTHASSEGYKLACVRCHHTGESTGCAECHGDIAMLSGEAIVPKAKRAFHLTCQGCHDSLAASNPATVAPTTCDGCHSARDLDALHGRLPKQRAYHLACIGCHTEVLEKNPDSKGPTQECGACHTGPVGAAAAAVKAGAEAVAAAEAAAALLPEPKPESAGAEDAGADAATAGGAPAEDGAPAAPAAAPARKLTPDMTIGFAKAAMSGTPFAHAGHQGMGIVCTQCHHMGLGDPSCRTCHTSNAMASFHKVCIDCHKAKGGPEACESCHP